jgi:RNA polymerase sigma-70 factor (ECF subfamily)
VREPDPALVRRARDGDEDAFAEIVRELHAPVVRYIGHLVHDRGLAEDVAQETFVRCYRNLGRYEFRGRFTTWLVQIARNAGIDAIRARDRHARNARHALPPAPPADPQLRAEVRMALASLPSKHREPLLLVEVAGLTYDEAGEVLRIPAGTVKSRVFLARRRLAAWLGATDDEDGGDAL